MVTPLYAEQNSAYDNLSFCRNFTFSMKKSEIFFGIIKIPMDFIMTVLAFLAAYQFRIYADVNQLFEKGIDYTVLPTISEYLQFSTYAACALVFIFAINRM